MAPSSKASRSGRVATSCGREKTVRTLFSQNAYLSKRINVIWGVQSRLEKDRRFHLTQIKIISAAVSSHQEGRLAIVTNAGRDAMDADVLRTNSAGCGRQNRVVLTPRRRRQASGKYPAGDGDNNARSPGRARYKP